MIVLLGCLTMVLFLIAAAVWFVVAIVSFLSNEPFVRGRMRRAEKRLLIASLVLLVFTGMFVVGRPAQRARATAARR